MNVLTEILQEKAPQTHRYECTGCTKFGKAGARKISVTLVDSPIPGTLQTATTLEDPETGHKCIGVEYAVAIEERKRVEMFWLMANQTENPFVGPRCSTPSIAFDGLRKIVLKRDDPRIDPKAIDDVVRVLDARGYPEEVLNKFLVEAHRTSNICEAYFRYVYL